MSEVRGEESSEPRADAFVSHCSRCKALFVRPLVECLHEQGLLLWYDEYSMQPGDSLSASIDRGLARANSGIVVISPAFIETAVASGWTHYELRGLVSNSIGPHGRRIVPVWLDVTREEVLAWSPPIADLIAIDASGKGIEEIALEILRVLAPDRTGGLARMRLLAAAQDKGQHGTARFADLNPAPAVDRRVPGSVPLRALLVTLAMHDCGVEHATNFSDFLENLSRDLHYEGELRLWEAIAATYATAAHTFDLDEKKRRALYSFLLSATLGVSDEDALKTLTADVAGAALEYLRQWYPALEGDVIIGTDGLRGFLSDASDGTDGDGREDSDSS